MTESSSDVRRVLKDALDSSLVHKRNRHMYSGGIVLVQMRMEIEVTDEYEDFDVALKHCE